MALLVRPAERQEEEWDRKVVLKTVDAEDSAAQSAAAQSAAVEAVRTIAASKVGTGAMPACRESMPASKHVAKPKAARWPGGGTADHQVHRRIHAPTRSSL